MNGLLQGLGQGMAQAGETMTKLTLEEMKAEMMAKYKLQAEERKAQREAAKTPTNISLETGDDGSQYKVSSNAAGEEILREQVAPKGPMSNVGKMVKDYQSLGDDDPMKAVLMDAINKSATHAPGATTEAPSSVREWEYYNNLSPDQQRQYREMKRSQSVVDLGGGYGVYDSQTGGISELEGGKKDLAPHQTPEYIADAAAAGVIGKDAGETEVNRPTAEATLKSHQDYANNVMSIIDGVLPQVTAATGGVVGKLTSGVAGSPAYDVKQAISTIKANLAFDRLQAMRDASKTGGALGAISERELDLLMSAVASLDEGQSPDQLRSNLGRVKTHYQNYMETMQAIYEGRYGVGSGGAAPAEALGQPSADPAQPGGISPVGRPAPMAALRALYANPDRIDDFVAKYGYKPEGF